MYKPSSPKDLDELPRIGSKMAHGIFLGYAQQAGGGWSGDVEVMDSRDLTHATSVDELRTERINANEITVLKGDGVEQSSDKVTFDNFTFPIVEEKSSNRLMVGR